MTAPSSEQHPIEILRFDASLEFYRIRRSDGVQEWTIRRRDGCLGGFETLQEAIAGAWVALMITKQGMTADMLWHWRTSVVNGKRAA